jgi:hypothetical protein
MPASAAVLLLAAMGSAASQQLSMCIQQLSMCIQHCVAHTWLWWLGEQAALPGTVALYICFGITVSLQLP